MTTDPSPQPDVAELPIEVQLDLAKRLILALCEKLHTASTHLGIVAERRERRTERTYNHECDS